MRNPLENDAVRERTFRESHGDGNGGGRNADRVLVCAWCRRVLGAGPRKGEALENFGICPRCANEQLSRVASSPGALG